MNGFRNSDLVLQRAFLRHGLRLVCVMMFVCVGTLSAFGQTNTIQYYATGASGDECPNGQYDPASSCDWYLDGSGGIVLNSVPQDVAFDVILDDWGCVAPQCGPSPPYPDTPLAVYQNEIDCATLDNGSACLETLPGGMDNCDNDYEQACIGIDEDHTSPPVIFDSLIPAFPNTTKCGGACLGEIGTGLGALAFPPTAAVSYADAGMQPRYGGQMGVTVPADARGVYVVNMVDDPALTLMTSSSSIPLPVTRVGMRIEIETGSCCGVNGEPLQCGDDYLASECASAGGGFGRSCICQGIPNPADNTLDRSCFTCDINLSCDDGNYCTDDVCYSPGECGGSYCTNPPTAIALIPGLCCNPNTGAGTPLSDGDPCTEDICESWGGVTHEPIPAGGACMSPNECIINATCTQAGFCSGQSVVGQSCTDNEDCGLGLCLDGGCVCVPSTGCCLDDACAAVSEDLCVSMGGQPLASCRDIDLDGASGCDDLCPEDPAKTEPGECGCGVSDYDSDGDSVPNCFDICPGGNDFLDEDNDGVPDECSHPFTIPTVSEWGLAILALLLLVVGKLRWNKRLAT